MWWEEHSPLKFSTSNAQNLAVKVEDKIAHQLTLM